MRIAVLTPDGEGQLGVSFARALSLEGHEAPVIEAGALTAGSRELIVARRLKAERALSAALRRPIERKLAELAPQVTLVVKGRFLSAADVEALRRASGGLVVNYFPDNPFFPDLYERPVVDALRAYDAVFIWSQDLAERLARIGVRSAHYLPFGYDEELYRPARPVGDAEYDVAFVGQWSALRERHIRALAGLRVVVAGPGWERRIAPHAEWCTVVPGMPHGRQAADVYDRCNVGLNVLHPQNAHAHNMRTWELPATGAPCAMTASDCHERLFGTTGISAFDGPERVRGAVEALLEDESARRSMAEAGHAAVRHGTYRARMRDLLSIVDGVAPAR